MAMAKQKVDVYANGLGFVVVPVAGWAEDEEVELAPVHRVSLDLGHAVVVELAQALEASRDASAPDVPASVEVWDGDDGRWWDHNLAFVRLTWYPDKVTFAPQAHGADKRWRTASVDALPVSTNVDDLSRMLIRYLGEQLHA